MSENVSVEIYTKFLNQAKLKQVDRETLKKKRGFTDKTIDELKFISGGKQNRKIINDLRDEYDDQVLLKVGMLEEVNENLRPCSMLLDDRIIIPYLDESGEKATLLRPHKLGLRGVNIQPYCRCLLKDKPEHVIMTEGEFKAAALLQWGIPGFAVPGIQSFSGDHFDNLVDMIKEFEIKKITIIFDNEVKDDPQYSNYKEKPEKRWDTPFWACVMQQKLYKKSKKDNLKIDVRISRLPDDWRVDGKIDFDGALAQGRTKNEIVSVRDERKSQEQYIRSLSEEAQKVVRKKIVQYFVRSPIERKIYGYTIRRKKQEAEWDEQISNFVINIKSSFFTPDGVMRYVQFVNEYGETSQTFILEPDSMSGVNQFKKYCFSKGNYIWEGNTHDLQEVWKYELRQNTGDMIYMPEQIGEVEPGFWLFGNIAVVNGQVYHSDSDGIFWIDGKGYKPQSLSVDPRGESMEDAIPALYIDDDYDIEQIADTLRENLGGYHAYIGIGWVIATVFSRVIFEEIGCFPFLFLHGKRESGKTTFMRWLMLFFGIEVDGTSIDESSQNYIMRCLSYFSSLGVWFDEYRNERDITKKDGYLRSAYNRQLSGKGVKSAFGARAYRVKGTLAISGEELPKDSGLYTRCVPLQMSANKRDRESYQLINRTSEKFSGFTFHLLKNYEKYRKIIISDIRELKKKLVKKEITDRTAENWAIMAGCFCSVVKEDRDFIKWVLKTCTEVRKTAEDEHMLNVFWSDIVILFSDRTIYNKHVKTHYEDGKSYIAIWFRAVFNIWEEYYRKRTGNQPFDKSSIIGYIKDEDYYVGDKVLRLDGHQKRCYIIDPYPEGQDGEKENSNVPDIIREFLDDIIQSEK